MVILRGVIDDNGFMRFHGSDSAPTWQGALTGGFQFTMALEWIPTDHIVHLARKFQVLKSEEEDIVRRLEAREANTVDEILTRLERHHKGISNYLADIWHFRGSRTIQLWEMPFLTEQSVEKVLNPKFGGQQLGFDWVSPRLKGKKAPVDKWTDVAHPKSANGKDRVIKVKVTPKAFSARVRLTKSQMATFEDTRQMQPRSVDVDIIIHFRGKSRVAEVYAHWNDAKDALAVFVQWCTALDISTMKKPQREKYLKPIDFKEQQIKAMATRLALENTSVRGRPPTNEVGDLQLWGHMKGSRRAPLDRTVAAVAAMDAVPTSLRSYNMLYRHGDGFEEETEVEFHFRPSRLFFQRKTSRPAIDHAVLELCREMKIQ